MDSGSFCFCFSAFLSSFLSNFLSAFLINGFELGQLGFQLLDLILEFSVLGLGFVERFLQQLICLGFFRKLLFAGIEVFSHGRHIKLFQSFYLRSFFAEIFLQTLESCVLCGKLFLNLFATVLQFASELLKPRAGAGRCG
jgi:hypothetical protein